MNGIKNTGPIILPCGTPCLYIASPDSFPRTWTTCFLLHRYERHQLSSWLATSYTFNWWWGQWCLQISHAVYRLHYNATAYEMSLRYRISVENEGLVALFIIVFLKILWRVQLYVFSCLFLSSKYPKIDSSDEKLSSHSNQRQKRWRCFANNTAWIVDKSAVKSGIQLEKGHTLVLVGKYPICTKCPPLLRGSLLKSVPLDFGLEKTCALYVYHQHYYPS